MSPNSNYPSLPASLSPTTVRFSTGSGSSSGSSISLPSSPLSLACLSAPADAATASAGGGVGGEHTWLARDCSSRHVQEWLAANRLGQLRDTFAHYTSNDILRLSKEDMVSLCGAPDGIRCFNVAHNMQVRPRLTLFVTFQRQSYFSAVFIAEWKSKSLSQKILELYGSFVSHANSVGKDVGCFCGLYTRVKFLATHKNTKTHKKVHIIT